MVKKDKKNTKRFNDYLVFSSVALAIFLIDQFSKWIIYNFHISARLLPFLEINTTENTGAAFGIFRSYSILLIIINILVIGLIIYYLDEISERKINMISLAMIAGGALGNLADRIFLGAVRDFIFVTPYFPTFNLADSAITIGAVIFIINYIRFEK